MLQNEQISSMNGTFIIALLVCHFLNFGQFKRKAFSSSSECGLNYFLVFASVPKTLKHIKHIP